MPAPLAFALALALALAAVLPDAPAASRVTPASTATPATGEPGGKRPFDRMDVFALEWVSDPRLAPDGEHVVYVRNGMDILGDTRTSRLWIVARDGTGNEPLTGREANEHGAVWSPDGTRVAFVSDGPGDAGSEIYVTWVASGKTTRLTQLERSPSGLTWSPDGQQLAFTMRVPEKPPVLVEPPEAPENAEWAEKPRVTTRLKYERDGAGYLEPGYSQLFVLPALGGTPRQVTSGEYRHEGSPRWMPEGRSLVFSGNRDEGWQLAFRDTEIYRVDLATGAVTALTQRDGPDTGPVISPDGRRIAWLGFEDRVQTYQIAGIRVMNADGTGKRDVPLGLDRSVSGLAWNGAGDGLYFQYDDRGETKIGFTPLDGPAEPVAGQLGGTTIGRPYGGGSFSVGGRDTLAYTHVTPYRPAELAVVEAGGEPEILTAFNADWTAWRELGEVEELWYESSVDGRRIQGWLVKPPEFDPDAAYPLLVENHGGPISNYGPRFSPEIQLYAAAGYLVFYPNPRGSTGYGEAFGNLLFHDYPGDDYQDVMDGVDHLVDRGLAREDRLFVTGGSAGGIMTAWIVGRNDRFEAAVVAKPVMNWISKTLTADNYFMYADYRYPGQPWERFETYWKFSPVSLVGEIETPTMVMVGTEDLRTPISEAKQLYGALKIRGIETALVELPGAPHDIARRPSQLIAKVDHVLAWFERHDPGGEAAGDTHHAPGSAGQEPSTMEAIEYLRTPQERFAGLGDYPFRARYAQVSGGLRMHYVDEGPEDGPVVVLLHGEPSWSYLYRRMIGPLAGAGFRVIAPDLVGFGKSDKPTDRAAYSYARQVRWTADLLFETLDLQDVRLFAQDWGGLIGLRLVAAQPDRFSRVAVSNTALPTGDEPLGPAFERWRALSQELPVFPAGQILQRGTVTSLSPEAIAAYEAPFPDERYKAGARTMPMLVPSTPDDPAAEANRRAWAVLSGFEKPFLTLFSDQDPVTRGADAPMLARIPGTRGQPHATIESAGHFVQEDRPEALVERLLAFFGAP